MKSLVRSLILASALVIEFFMREAMTGYVQDNSLNDIRPFIPIVTGVIALVFYFLSEQIIFQFKSIKLIRRRFISPGNYEGYWFSKATEEGEVAEAKFGISKIYYDSGEKCWIHHGYGYDQYCQRIREWRNKSYFFQSATREWFFSGKVSNHDSAQPNIPRTAYNHREQIAVIDLKREPRSRPLALFFDQHRNAGREPIYSGRASMIWIPKHFLNEIVGFKVRKIEEIPQEKVTLLAAAFSDRLNPVRIASPRMFSLLYFRRIIFRDFNDRYICYVDACEDNLPYFENGSWHSWQKPAKSPDEKGEPKEWR